jgi:hypothetical protein
MSEQGKSGSAAEAFQRTPVADTSRLAAARRQGRSLREKRAEGTAPRERENSFGGLSLNLYVNGEIPGYHLVWENDDNGAIETRLMQGFDFVTQDELYARQAKIVPDEEISSAISRFVKGTRSDGQALRAYLLKLPDEEWAELERVRHEAADEWDRAIRRQAEEPDQKAGLRSLKNLRSEVDTGYRKEYELGEKAKLAGRSVSE